MGWPGSREQSCLWLCRQRQRAQLIKHHLYRRFYMLQAKFGSGLTVVPTSGPLHRWCALQSCSTGRGHIGCMKRQVQSRDRSLFSTILHTIGEFRMEKRNSARWFQQEAQHLAFGQSKYIYGDVSDTWYIYLHDRIDRGNTTAKICLECELQFERSWHSS